MSARKASTPSSDADGKVSRLLKRHDHKKMETPVAQEELLRFEIEWREQKLKLQPELLNTKSEAAKPTTLAERMAKPPNLM